MLRINELEDQLHTLEKNQLSQMQSDTLSIETDSFEATTSSFEKYRNFFFDFSRFFMLPLLLLVLAHVCITIIYDTKIVYLRIVTLILPMCFGYFLYHKQSRNTLVWLICVVTLGWVSVAGMSVVTSHVDDSPIWPQTIYVWRDLIEFAMSITFSYVTGMLLGRLSFLKSNSPVTSTTVITHTAGGWFLDKNEEQVPSASLQIIAKKINEFTATLGAIITTIIAIYTGLKGLL
ncbi:hypothetical protein [Zwartia sp.]|uniref:hypothetical protein n=1 Tax=Zwartia sp. TaxID=2978004 RepID=UPI003BAF141B